ncbi:MAG: hypothetical protein ACFE96_06240 [Candidatus Hermodarchaeota archaeon]
MTIEKDISCFVIMPFSQSSEKHTEKYWTNHFNEFLKPTIEELPEIKVFRIEVLREDILDTIINNLVVADIVIADITDHNPNVFWELGVRQSFRHNTIIIAEIGTELPFDLSVKATIFYDLTEKEKIVEFRVKFKDAILDCINNPYKTDSHVLERLSGRGSLYEILRLDEARRRVEALLVESKRNQQFFEEACNLVSKMTKKSYIYPEFRFIRWSTTSLESLVSNRYRDEDLRFYNTATYVMEVLQDFEKISVWINTMNEEEKDSYLERFDKNARMGRQIERMLTIWINSIEGVYQKINKRMSYQITSAPIREAKDFLTKRNL